MGSIISSCLNRIINLIIGKEKKIKKTKINNIQFSRDPDWGQFVDISKTE